jgi:hypothetical protein
MLPDVIRATYRDGYSIEIEFDDGARGIVDFSRYLTRGGVFERFKDIDFFRNFHVDSEIGVLSWGGEVDIAPETLYAEATGRGLPEWMQDDKERGADTSELAPSERTK